MKSRTSLFNFPVFWKNVSRFFPVWGLYVVILVLYLVTETGRIPAHFANSLSYMAEEFVVFHFFYAGVCALCLFGDLFQSRMCNALHAMPLTRDSWFVTHVLSGLAFSMVPTFLFCLICMLCLGGWQVPLLLFCAMTLQYLFFFGVAVFAVFCTGNRLAALLTYLMVNFLAPACYLFYYSIYEPMLYGIETNGEWLEYLCPFIRFAQCEFIDVEILTFGEVVRGYTVHITEGWGYAAICAGVGLVFGIIAFLFYRRRKLEYAGDFIAVKKATVLYLIAFALAVGLLFFAIEDFLLLPGCIIGFFGGRMLLDKSLKVFGKRNILSCLALLGVVILSLILTALDPLGITRWVPKAEQVESVMLSKESYYFGSRNSYAYTDPQQIEDFLTLHEAALTPVEIGADGYYPDTADFTLDYTLKNGLTAHRSYRIEVDSEAGQLLKFYLSQKEQVIGAQAANWEEFVSHVDHLELGGNAHWNVYEPAQLAGLLEAIRLDCEEGNLTQHWGYNKADTCCWITLVMDSDFSNDFKGFYAELRVTKESRHILNWLKENNFTYILE